MVWSGEWVDRGRKPAWSRVSAEGIERQRADAGPSGSGTQPPRLRPGPPPPLCPGESGGLGQPRGLSFPLLKVQPLWSRLGTVGLPQY
jgi:hypothetical protein